MAKLQHIDTSIPGHEKSIAYISTAVPQDVERAVIFVHGFGGDAKTTWTNFVALTSDPSIAGSWWANADLYFYHYKRDSIFRQVLYNTKKLRGFIDLVFPTPPANLISGLTSRANGFSYKFLTMVGHSEGGLLLRHIIIDAADADSGIKAFMRAARYSSQVQPAPSGILSADLRLFAPAIAGEALSGLSGILASAPGISNIVHASSAKKSMAPTSPAVSAPREDTQRYTDYLDFQCFKAHIIWAENDKVVLGKRYREDIECDNFPFGSDHQSICKPNLLYLTPVKFVEMGVPSNAKC